MWSITCVRSHEVSTVTTQLLSCKLLLLWLTLVVLPMPCHGLSSVEIVSARGVFHNIVDSHLKASADDNDKIQVSPGGGFHSIDDTHLPSSADDNHKIQAIQRESLIDQKLGAHASTGDNSDGVRGFSMYQINRRLHNNIEGLIADPAQQHEGSSDHHQDQQGSGHWEPPSAIPDYSIFAVLAERVFDKVIVICYRERCDPHYPGGGIWPDRVRHRIIVQDGFHTDEENADVLRQMASTSNLRNHSPSEANFGHNSRAWLSHMKAVETASHMGLSNVLIMEDDLVPSKFATSHLKNVTTVEKLAGTLRETLAKIQWQGLKFTAKYCGNYWQCEDADCGYLNPKCTERCACHNEPEWQKSYFGDLAMCQTDHKLGDCYLPNSAMYALHESIFPVYLRSLQAARTGQYQQDPLLDRIGPYIDDWISDLDLHHLLPSIGIQSHKNPRQEICSESFRTDCSVSDVEPFGQ